MFLLDGGDVIVVNDPADASLELEPFLVDEPVEFFDALARPLRLVVDGGVRKRWFLDVDDRSTIGLELLSAEPDEERLRAALVAYLERIGRSVPDEPTFQAFTTSVARMID